MRRILALSLLIAFSSPLLVPLLFQSILLAATPDSPKFLQACCRKAGVHHCTSLSANAPSAPALNAPPCADYPPQSAPLRLELASLQAPLLPSADPLLSPIQLAPYQRLAETAAPSAHPKRGPPARLA